MKKKSAETAKEEADDVQTIIDYATNFVHEKKELDKEKEQFKDSFETIVNDYNLRKAILNELNKKHPNKKIEEIINKLEVFEIYNYEISGKDNILTVILELYR